MNIPVLFCDIDGVLAPIGATGLPAPHKIVDGGAWNGHVIVVPSVIDRVRDLHRAGRVEIRWLTSWENDAATNFAPAVGMDTYPAYGSSNAELDAANPDRDWWKEQIVRAFVRDNPFRQFIWADDEIAERGALTTDLPDHGLLLSPNPYVGLTDIEFDAIENFLDVPKSASAAVEPINQRMEKNMCESKANGGRRCGMSEPEPALPVSADLWAERGRQDGDEIPAEVLDRLKQREAAQSHLASLHASPSIDLDGTVNFTHRTEIADTEGLIARLNQQIETQAS